MNKLFALGMGAAFSLAAAGAQAATIQHTGSFDGANQHLYQLLGGIGATSLNTEAKIDAAQILNDQYWSVQASGGSVTTMIFEISANDGKTTFGVYDRFNSASRVALWGGSATQGNQVTLTLLADGSVKVNNVDTGTDFATNAFGYYIQIDSTVFFSDESLNQDGADQMATFRGNGSDLITIPGYFPGIFGVDEYILAWEDILASSPVGNVPGGTDNDYNDLVVLVESVNINVPEPATLALFGAGLLGLGMIRRRKA